MWYHSGDAWWFRLRIVFYRPIALTDVDVPITKFIDDEDELFVHTDAEENVKYAFGYAKIYEKCHGNFEKIAEMLDEEISIIKNVEEENI